MKKFTVYLVGGDVEDVDAASMEFGMNGVLMFYKEESPGVGWEDCLIRAYAPYAWKKVVRADEGDEKP